MADSLSCLHQPDPENSSPEPILLPVMIVSPIQWSIDKQITQANRTEPALPGGPQGLLYVPPWGLDTKVVLSLLCHRYWWPTMAQDIS